MSIDEEALPIKAKRRFRLRTILLALVVIAIGVGTAVLLETNATSAELAAFKNSQKSISFPVYYPSKIPSAFSINPRSLSTSGGLLAFPIANSNGQSIEVTEQNLPSQFDISKVNGLFHNIPGIGTVAIGSGFLGQLGFIKTAKTLITLSAPTQISAGDLQSIAYNFKPL
jgi:hypothetical protein